MAYSKIILNGETLMDVTSDTVDAGNLLSGKTATKNSGTKVTGNIATKSSSDLTVNGATVTAPAGYYNTAASKVITTTTHPNPTAAIASSTGVVTATHTQGTGYVTGGTTTGTLNLTTQAAQTINTSTADQTIASNRWLTGTQTIKSVTTSNLTAANIASGVTVKVGDANNASRITQVIGTYAPAVSSLTVTPTETAQTFNATGVYGYKPVTVNAISSTYIGTGIAKKSSADTTFASTTGTFTAPVGYYSTAATKTLTTQAAQTIYPSTADQTIGSYRWLTGAQTIKSVTTSNLSAENIAEGVVVKVGDANNASRITQITGTHSGSQKHTITIDGTGDATYCYVTYKNQKYYSNSTFEYEPGDTLTIYCRGNTVFLNYTQLLLNSNYHYDYILPDYAGDITIKLHYSNLASNNIYIYTTYEKYYAAVNAIAINTTNGLNNDIPGFSSYIANLLSIRPGMFAERDFNSGTYIFQSASAVGYYAFNCEHQIQNVKETTFYFPNCTIIHSDAFTYRNDFKSIYFPICSSIEYGAFSSCSGLTTISFPECTTIYSSAFYSCSALTLASFPKCTSLSDKVFANCKQLSKVYFPLCTSVSSFAFNQCGIISVSSSDFSNCTTIYSGAFMACMSLTSVNFPSCTSIGTSAFYNCYSLASISFPKCISIYAGAFYNCSALTLASFPKCDYIGASAFKYCGSLSNINFPSCTSISNYAFQYCSVLTSVNFPSCTSVLASAFGNCASLTIASFPKCTLFGTSAFTSCYNLISLYLTGVSSVPILSGAAVFYSTPISTYSTVAGRYGSIFVPSSLYTAFTTATGWSVYSARIVSV